MSKRTSDAHLALRSWSVTDWPAEIYPGTASKARYLIRAHRDELLKAGALSRVGRDFVVLGLGYLRWLEAQSNRVEGYRIALNDRRAPVDQAAA